MAPTFLSVKTISDGWQVLVLFLVPIGGGIPAGVLLAKNRALAWPITAIIYFISDVILACVFEPLMLLFISWSKKTQRMSRFREALSMSMNQVSARYGLNPGPWTLVMITFGTDPMTGRSIAKAAGHGFFFGWALTIMGDMIFFSVIMVSTLWLNNILGDGTWTAIIIVAAMLGIPPLVRKLRNVRWSF